MEANSPPEAGRIQDLRCAATLKEIEFGVYGDIIMVMGSSILYLLKEDPVSYTDVRFAGRQYSWLFYSSGTFESIPHLHGACLYGQKIRRAKPCDEELLNLPHT